jgi:hypothetical protein
VIYYVIFSLPSTNKHGTIHVNILKFLSITFTLIVC